MNYFRISIAALVLCLGCDNAGLDPAPSFHDAPVHATYVEPPIDMSSYRAFAASMISKEFTQMDLYVGKYEGYTYLNQERFVREDLTEIKTYLKVTIDPAIFADQMNFKIKSLTDNGAPFNLAVDVPGLTKHLSLPQISILDWYFNNMRAVTTASLAQSQYLKAQQRTMGDLALTRTQKIQVLAVVETSNEYMKAYFGKVNSIYLDLTAELGNASVTTPCIQVKSILRSAVISGFAAGIGGAVVGGTGGTVVLPVVGTVSGAVGGFWYGFAGGFIAGGGMSVVEQAIFNCWLKGTLQSAPDTRCQETYFFERNKEYCLQNAADHKRWYSKTALK